MRVIALRSFGGPELFAEEEWPVPEPRDDEVRIRVLAASFNPVDRYWRAGLVGDKLPVVLGRDFCGVVDAAGKAVLDLQSGDEVFGVHGSLASNGAYAEYLTLPPLLVARRPRKIGVVQAAALPIVGLTAMKCVQSKARFLSGQTALVTGSGGVGEMIVQLLRLAGASNIVTTAGSASGAAKLEQLGVASDRIVSYRGLEGAALLREALVRNGGRPFSAAFDTAGGALKRLCFEATEADGQVVSIVEEPVDYNLNLWDSPLVEKSLSFHFEQLSARAVGREAAKLALFREQLQQLAQLVDDGRLHPPAHEVLAPLSRETVQRAHEVLDHRKGPKLVMRIA